MRVVRFLMLLLGVAIAVAGCAQRPVAYMTYPSPGISAPSPGIDNVVYGMGAPRVPAATAVSYTALQYPAPAAMAPAAIATAPVAPVPVVPAAMVAPRYVSAVPPTPVVAAPPPAGVYAYAAAIGPGDYALDSGDRLRIVVFGQEGLTNAYAVDAAGFIDMPLIGPVLARGATTEELAARVSAKLRNGFIREPHVAVEIEAYRPFFILGEVTAPGQYPYVANMTAEAAVAIAGGFTPRAFRRNLIVNRNFNGRPMRMTVPLTFPLPPATRSTCRSAGFNRNQVSALR
jgi:polysaccharide biosynthesis/export protein